MSNEMSKKIHELRKQHKLTLEQVANVVGVGKSTVRKWETGMIANMKRDKIALLAQALHTTPSYLMGWDDPNMSLGQKISYLRTKANLTQEELASHLGTTKQAIYKYETGIVTNIPMDKLVLIADVLDTTPAYLMGWEKEPSPISEPPLTEEEEVLLSLFRRVPEDQQQLVLRLIQTALGNQE